MWPHVAFKTAATSASMIRTSTCPQQSCTAIRVLCFQAMPSRCLCRILLWTIWMRTWWRQLYKNACSRRRMLCVARKRGRSNLFALILQVLRGPCVWQDFLLLGSIRSSFIPNSLSMSRFIRICKGSGRVLCDSLTGRCATVRLPFALRMPLLRWGEICAVYHAPSVLATVRNGKSPKRFFARQSQTPAFIANIRRCL